MRIDRLLGLVVYLLNRDIVSARALAERFEVSPRTIQRDIEALSRAGIPVVALQGANGGYGIADGFRMSRQVLGTDDYVFILTALRGLCSAYENRRLTATLEKLTASSPAARDARQQVSIDLGVSREGGDIPRRLSDIEAAIAAGRAIGFDYADAAGRRTQRLIDPLIIAYRWYAWYVFGFCRERQDYRLFRLSRMRRVTRTDSPFVREHGDAARLLAGRTDQRPRIDVRLRCSSQSRISVEEAFPYAQVTEIENDEVLVEFTVPESERGWFSFLLGFGDRVTVLGPPRLREMLLKRAGEIVAKYSRCTTD